MRPSSACACFFHMRRMSRNSDVTWMSALDRVVVMTHRRDSLHCVLIRS